jgi:hypothetical protein
MTPEERVRKVFDESGLKQTIRSQIVEGIGPISEQPTPELSPIPESDEPKGTGTVALLALPVLYLLLTQ